MIALIKDVADTYDQYLSDDVKFFYKEGLTFLKIANEENIGDIKCIISICSKFQ